MGRGFGGIAGVVKVKVFFFMPFSERIDVVAVYLVFGLSPLKLTFVESESSKSLNVLVLEEEDLSVIE